MAFSVFDVALNLDKPTYFCKEGEYYYENVLVWRNVFIHASSDHKQDKTCLKSIIYFRQITFHKSKFYLNHRS